MRVLITGSEGTLGRPLAVALAERGHRVWGCDLQHAVSTPVREYVRVDVSEYRQLERMLRGVKDFDVVYHLAAEFGRMNGEEFYEQTWRTNVIGTRHLLELQREHGFKLILASSSEVYGEGQASELAEHVTERLPLRHLNDYATTKWVNEVQCMNFEAQYGSPIMRLRFFNAYGPGERYHDYRSVVCLFCYRALMGIPYEVYEGYHRVFMYVDDFIRTLATACERFHPGEVINIGGEEYRSVRELSDIVLAETEWGTDSLVTYLSDGEYNVTNKRPNIDKAIRLLGHENIVRLEEGVRRTVEWMRREYVL